MENKICCVFEEKNAKKAIKEKKFELVNWLVNSYRHDRVLYRCKKCGGLVLYEYEEEAHFLPGEDWDNAYCEEYYWPVLQEDIQTVDGDVEFNWGAISVRKHIVADYRELDRGEKPYYFVEAKPTVEFDSSKEFSQESPAKVIFDTLPADKRSFDDMCIFIQIPEYPTPRGLEILLPNHNDPRAIRVLFQNGTYSMKMIFSMEDFGWTHPLILGTDGLSFEDVKLILTEICLNQRASKEIDIVVHGFQDITAQIYPDA